MMAVEGRTVTVPAEYADDFREAVIEEIAQQVEFNKKDRAELAEAIKYRKPEKTIEIDRADLALSTRLLIKDTRLLDLVSAAEGELSVPVERGDGDGTLSYAFETMARKVVGPRLTEALGFGPFVAESEDELRELTSRLMWAVEQAAALNETRRPDALRKTEDES
jgi:hypothetical protein